MAYEAETAIYNRLRQAPTFHPAGAALFVPDWTLEPGDVVTVRSGEDDYQVPVYSMDLQWQGQSRVNIQSTGNQKREPLPAMQRRRYATGRTVYQQEQAIEELQEQTVEYTQKFEVSDQRVASIMTATGVLLDEETNLPVVDPVTGLFVFDTTNQGATLQSRIDQNASAISLEATTRASGDTRIEGLVSVEAGKISQIVSAVGKDGQVTAASIILAINGGGQESSAIIRADKIDLQGYVTATELFATDAEIGQYLKADNIIATGKIRSVSLDVSNGATIADLQVSEGSTLTGGVTVDHITIGYPASSGYQITQAIAGGIIKDATVANNVLTLTKVNNTTVNFSKATTLYTGPVYADGQQKSGGWAGGTFTVIATQTNKNTTTNQNETNEVARTTTRLHSIAANGDPTRNSVLPKYLNVPLKVLYDDGEDGGDTYFTDNISVNASLIWQDGYDAGGGGAAVNPELYIQSSWDYDSENEKYTKTVQIRDGQTVIETDYVELPEVSATKVSLTKGSISMTSGTTYSGSYSISRSSGGDVTVSGVQGAGFTVGVNALTMALELTQPTATQFTWNTSGTNAYKYTYQTDASVSVDGTANVLTRRITGLVLNPTDAIDHGWDNASEVVVKPSSTSPGSTVSISWPYSRTSGGTTTRGTDTLVYTLRSTHNDAYLSIASGNETWVNYAHIQHGMYDSGQDSVNVSGPVWSRTGDPNASNTATFSTSAGSGTGAALSLSMTNTLGEPEWNNTNHTYSLSAVAVTSDGNSTPRLRATDSDVLTPTAAINYGKTLVTVGSTFTTASAPSGVTPTPLTSGETYKLSVTKDGVTVTGSDVYYSVPAAPSVNPTLHIGDTWDYDDGNYTLTVQIKNGTTVLATDYVELPSTKVIVGTPTATWSSANHNYTLSASAGDYLTADTSSQYVLATGSGSGTLVPTDAINYGKTLVTGRTVTSITPTVTLSDANTGTSTHTVTVTYSDGDTGSASVSVNAARVYSAGQLSVTVSTVTVSNITASVSARTAQATFTVKLDNNVTKSVDGVDVSEAYYSGYDGTTPVTSKSYDFRLVDGNGTFVRNRQKSVNLSGVYQQGVDDASGGGFPKTMYIYASNGGTVNVRQSASTSQAPIGALYPKTQVTVVAESGSYYQISFTGIPGTPAQSGYTSGYVQKTYVSDSSTSPTNYGYKRGWQTYLYVYANNGGMVNVRASASSSGTVIGQLYPRTAIQDIGESGDYFLITFSGISGTPARSGYSEGYIMKSFTSTSSNSPTNHGSKRGWYEAIKNGDSTGNSTYPYYGVTTGTATNIYSRPDGGGTIVFTAGRNSNIMCSVNPANQSAGWTPCKLNAFEGYVQLSSFH